MMDKEIEKADRYYYAMTDGGRWVRFDVRRLKVVDGSLDSTARGYHATILYKVRDPRRHGEQPKMRTFKVFGGACGLKAHNSECYCKQILRSRFDDSWQPGQRYTATWKQLGEEAQAAR